MKIITSEKTPHEVWNVIFACAIETKLSLGGSTLLQILVVVYGGSSKYACNLMIDTDMIDT